MTSKRKEAGKQLPLTHIDRSGEFRMVDVTSKSATERRALAKGELLFSGNVADTLARAKSKKGDPVAVARVAGIMAAKRVHELIPLCHQLLLSDVNVTIDVHPSERKAVVRSEVATTASTGVEMEALTAVSVALLTLYDMIKSADRAAKITNIVLSEKSGGKSGHYLRKASGSAC